MAISDNYSPDKSLGNGVTTQFTGSWSVLNQDYFRLYLEDAATGVQTLQTLGSDYSLSFDDSGYTAVMAVAPTSANWVVRAREVSIDQTTPYKTSQGFQGKTEENSFDKITAIAQDLQDQIGRSVQFAVGSAVTGGNYQEPVDGALLAWLGTDGDVQNILLSDVDVVNSNSSLIGLATNDFLVYNAGLSLWQNKALATVQTILGLGTAAYQAASAFATSAQGTRADNSVQYAEAIGFINGLSLSNNVTDANNDIDVAVGSALSEDATLADRVPMSLASAIVKRLDATWAVGTNQGGLDTGSKANSTWYHVWLIKRVDTGVVDVLFSTSPTAPTMPTSYTKKRRIGSVRTDGSGNVLGFVSQGNQDQRTYLWNSPTEDLDFNNGTSASLRVLKVPTGIKVQPMMNVLMVTASIYHYFSSPDTTDISVNGTGTPFGQMIASTTNLTVQLDGRGIITDTSGQIRARASGAGQVKIATIGWTESL